MVKRSMLTLDDKEYLDIYGFPRYKGSKYSASEAEDLAYFIVDDFERTIQKIMHKCQSHQELEPSGFDPYVGVTLTNINRYRQLLSPALTVLKKKHQKNIKELGLESTIDEIIKNAKAFDGAPRHDIDPKAQPAYNHHTGSPCY